MFTRMQKRKSNKKNVHHPTSLQRPLFSIFDLTTLKFIQINSWVNQFSTSRQKQSSLSNSVAYSELDSQLELLQMDKQLTYAEIQRQLACELQQIELQISELEDQYIRRTQRCGNIIKGFSSYIANKSLMIHSDDPVKIKQEERLFSLSSVNSPVSRPRKTRGSSKKQQRVIQATETYQIKREEPTIDEYSIDSCYSREGSLNKHPQSADQYLPKYRSEGDQSRTISETSHFHSIETEDDELELKESKPRKKVKIQSDKQNPPKPQKKQSKKVSKKLKAQPSSPIEMEVQPKESEQTVPKIESPSIMEQQKEEEENSCDSVELFMRMANRRE